MGIEIYRKENWDRWEHGDFQRRDFLRLDPEKDRLLLGYALSHCSNVVRLAVIQKSGLSEIPELPVNINDESDERYGPYLMLREQVRRESDYWVLRDAAFQAPEPMCRFAFCRLTGFAWPSSECDAYSYRTYSCGLQTGLVREDIVALCQEMVEKNGPFATEAIAWLRELPSIRNEELAVWASEKTERRWDKDTSHERKLER